MVFKVRSMSAEDDHGSPDKISRQFAARLDRLAPKDEIQAVVLLSGPEPEERAGRRQNRSERREAVERVRGAAGKAVGQVDEVLARFGGRRLSDCPDALGSLPVETTSAGIHALAECDAVSAVLEDQPIRRVP